MPKRIPKQERSKAKYEAIIRSIRRIIDKGEFDQSSTHTIAEEAGVGIGTLYEYFDSKEDILALLYEREAEVVWAALETEAASWVIDRRDPAEGLAHFIVDFSTNNRALVKVLFGRVPDTFNRPATLLLMGKLQSLLGQFLLLETKGVRQDHHQSRVFVLTHALLGIAIGIAGQTQPNSEIQPLVEQVTRIVNACLHQDADGEWFSNPL